MIGTEHSVAELFPRPQDVKAWFVHSHLNGRNTVTISVYSQTSQPCRASSRISFLSVQAPEPWTRCAAQSSHQYYYLINTNTNFSSFLLSLKQILFAVSPCIYLYIIFDQRRVDIIDQVEYGVHDRLHIYPLCGIFYFPWHRHQIEETIGFYCLFRKTLAKWGKGNCQSFQAASVGFEPMTTQSSLVHTNH